LALIDSQQGMYLDLGKVAPGSFAQAQRVVATQPIEKNRHPPERMRYLAERLIYFCERV